MSKKIIGVTVGTNINPKRLEEYVQDGKSAYDLAIENGFEGTEKEWLASLNGKDGQDGYTPIKGVDYFDGEDGQPGKDGADGKNGKDGYTPIKGKDYFDGKDGVNGKDGTNGKDGYTPIKGVDYFDGVNGADGKDGSDGYTPIKGTDYFTEEDVQEIAERAAEMVDVPEGGVTSWNDLTDKPFGEMPPAFDIQWDGVIGDKFALDLSSMGFPNMYGVKVSDSVFTVEELDGALGTSSNGAKWYFNNDTIDTSSFPGALSLSGAIIIVYDAYTLNAALGTPEGYITNGTYFICVVDEYYVNRLVAPTVIKTLDNKYLDLNLEEYAKTKELSAVATSGSWNDLTDKPFGVDETSWVLITSGTSSSISSTVVFNAIEGKNYKLEVTDGVYNTILATTIAPCLTAPMMGSKYYTIGTDTDAVYGNGGISNSSWRFTTKATSATGKYKFNIYEEHEAITTIDEKYLPENVVLENELNDALSNAYTTILGLGYQTEEQVIALINSALEVIENGTY